MIRHRWRMKWFMKVYVTGCNRWRMNEIVLIVCSREWIELFEMKDVLRVGWKGKLNPCFIGPFDIIDQIGSVAFKLILSPSLFVVHTVFHVCVLQKYLDDLTHIIDYESLQIDDDLSYETRPLSILPKEMKVFCTRKILFTEPWSWRNYVRTEGRDEREISWVIPRLRHFQERKFLLDV